MFYIFLRACKKYRFTYALNAVSGLTLILHPNNTFGFIEIKQEYYERNYFKLFIKAIKKMREYRKESGYR
jgi:hypothetical protein